MCELVIDGLLDVPACIADIVCSLQLADGLHHLFHCTQAMAQAADDFDREKLKSKGAKLVRAVSRSLAWLWFCIVLCPSHSLHC